MRQEAEAVQSDVDGNESDADTAIAANETHIDNMATLTGVAKDETSLATFTGGTISDSRTVKQALQELETAVETKSPTAGPTFTGHLLHLQHLLEPTPHSWLPQHSLKLLLTL